MLTVNFFKHAQLLQSSYLTLERLKSNWFLLLLLRFIAFAQAVLNAEIFLLGGLQLVAKVMIVIIHFISSLLFYPYNLCCIGCKVMFIVCDVLIILFDLFLSIVNCLFVHCTQCFNRKKRYSFNVTKFWLIDWRIFRWNKIKEKDRVLLQLL